MQNTEFQTGTISPVEIYKEAWALIKDRYWLVFAIVIVGMLLGGAIPVVLIGPMMCGMFICLFDLIDGRELKFETLFKGFDYIWKSLLVSVLIVAPILVMLFTIYIPIIGMALAGPRMSESELIPFLIGTFIFEIVVVVIMVCFHTLIMFAYPLIVERGLTGGQAIKVSAKAVWNNLAGMAGLLGVGFLVGIVGYMMLCVGLYLVLPLIMMAQAVAFRKIFPKLESKTV
ncbi:MAG: hypothetical protein IPI76_16255 [Chloracidobacterium sp.]|nr:hypothetical protein [Chloracidobacterium sp.]MBK9439233.1 hypothetical protein [Chloracidobacterium sp.]MBK9767045.1 hypothetical protein [Chloracidobacterium sp.]MBP9936374.1 hypothetical protein [Pyrinomonadaceae bacterium]